MLAEYDGYGQCLKEYIYIGAKMVAEYQPQTGKYYYYTTDQINSTRIVTDDLGNVVYAAAHDPYGAIQQTWVNIFTPELKFSGKEQDAESGLYYFGARYYDPTLYRFLSSDPVIPTERALYNPRRWNLYGYCGNNPLGFVDKNGSDPANILVIRLWEFRSQNITVGYLFLDNRWVGYTMEHNTKAKLPEGTYQATVKFGITDTGDYIWGLIIDKLLEGKYFVAFHLGWSSEHSNGCFLVGYNYDFDKNQLINSTAAFVQLISECIGHHDLGAALITYGELGLEDMFLSWLELDALSAIVGAIVTVKQGYVGNVPENYAWDPQMINPIYWA
ncbi:MAG: RHS repeat-associated core domain-containing protein [Candidatus Aminicenantes bacterium]|nr:RHS repeat-associated core domain-containing protein [Candidatus Aminicenantes bacterium]